MDEDQVNLRTQYPHWAQHLSNEGYATGYFGKWHADHSERLENFGWQKYATIESLRRDAKSAFFKAQAQPQYTLEGFVNMPEGYQKQRFYGAVDTPAEKRGMGLWANMAMEFLDEVMQNDAPWCCFLSVTEPHDPFYCSSDALAQYDIENIPLPPNLNDDFAERPGIYRKAGRAWQNWTERQHREAAACYYASISEIDATFGRVLDKVEQSGQLDNTIVVVTSDHGELLGAHGLYCKNFTAAEEIYNIPMILSGPGIAAGKVSNARVGLHDLGSTLLELAQCESIDYSDSRSFAKVLLKPHTAESNFQQGYAEYFGTRVLITQRVLWDGSWKFIFNGFDVDELYNMEEDPWEMNNLAEKSEHQPRVKSMMKQMWNIWKTTGDKTLLNSQYPILRIAPYGPDV